MRFRLDAQHYVDDRLLEPGMEVGDGEGVAHSWRYPADIHKEDFDRKAGQAMPPSVQMTPLDAEAKKLYQDTFGTGKPERDPTKAIPLQGTLSTAKVPPVVPAKPLPPTPKG